MTGRRVFFVIASVALVVALAGCDGLLSPGPDGPGGTLDAPGLPFVTDEGDGYVEIGWVNVVGASSYAVYRRVDGGESTLIAEPTGTLHLDSTVEHQTTYYYTVHAVSGTQFSDPSPELEVTYIDPTPGGEDGGSFSVEITSPSLYEPVSGTVDVVFTIQSPADVAEVELAVDGAVQNTQAGPFTTLSFNSTNIVNGNYKPITVTVTDELGNETSDTQEVHIDNSGSAIGTPVLNVDSVASTSIDFSWDPVPGATGYRIYQRESSAATFGAPVADVGDTTNSRTIGSLTPGTEYDFILVATDGTVYNDSSAVTRTTSAATSPPDAPTGVSAAAVSDTEITVSWTAPTGATSYEVRRSTSENGTYTAVGTPDGSPFEDTGLSPNTEYWYEVYAVNSAGTSPASARVSATTLTAPTISLEGGGQTITDGDTTPDATDDTDLGSAQRGATLASTFTVRNSGTASLTYSVSVSGSDYSLSGDTNATITGTGTRTFTVTLSTDATGTYPATVTVTSNDPANASYEFAITAERLASPRIRVLDAEGDEIVTGRDFVNVADGTYFQYHPIDETPGMTNTFTIENTGDADLTISGIEFADGTVYFSSPGAASATVAAGGSTTFDVVFAPTSGATPNVDLDDTVRVNSNDPVVSQHTFAVRGRPDFPLDSGEPDDGSVGSASVSIAVGGSIDRTLNYQDFDHTEVTGVTASQTYDVVFNGTPGGLADLASAGTVAVYASDATTIIVQELAGVTAGTVVQFTVPLGHTGSVYVQIGTTGAQIGEYTLSVSGP